MGEPFKLRSLEESLSFAEKAYRQAEKLSQGQPLPMSFDAWMKQAQERHAVMSHMNPIQLEVAAEEAMADNGPMLHAMDEALGNLIEALKKGKGTQFVTKLKKQKRKAEKEAKRLAKGVK
jgi:hypothetical protein